MFQEVISLAFQKFVDERRKHGDSWKTTYLGDITDFLAHHWKKFKNNFRENKILTILATKQGVEITVKDLLDIINYCVMVVQKLKGVGK